MTSSSSARESNPDLRKLGFRGAAEGNSFILGLWFLRLGHTTPQRFTGMRQGSASMISRRYHGCLLILPETFDTCICYKETGLSSIIALRQTRLCTVISHRSWYLTSDYGSATHNPPPNRKDVTIIGKFRHPACQVYNSYDKIHGVIGVLKSTIGNVVTTTQRPAIKAVQRHTAVHKIRKHAAKHPLEASFVVLEFVQVREVGSENC